MKKLYISLSALLVTGISASAQNGMGIGNNNPQEMLDVTGAIKIGNTANTNAGAIRWTGADFEGRTGSGWVSLTGGGGTDDQTATEVVVTPNTDLVATDVQGALEELQSEIVGTQPTIADVLGYGNDANQGQQLNIDRVSALDGDGLLLTDDGNNGLFIEDGGYVGIGTTDPSVPFEINKEGLDINVSSNVLARFEQATTAKGAGIQVTSYRNSANPSAFIDLNNFTAGNEYITARISGYSNAVGEEGSLLFYTNAGGTSNSGLTEQLRIAEDGLLTAQSLSGSGGNRLVQVNNAGELSFTALNPANIGTVTSVTASNGLTSSGGANPNITLGGTLSADTDLALGANDLTFSGSGNIGIGTDPPLAKIDVSGNIALNDNQIRLRAGNDANHYIAHLGGSFDGPILHGNQTVYLSTSQNSEGVRVLGSAAAGTQLVVDGSYDLGTMPPSESTLILGSRGGVEGAQIQMNNANSAGTAWFIDIETNDLRFLTGNNTTGSSGLAVTIESNGKLEAEELAARNGTFRSGQRADFYLSLQSDRNMVLYDGGPIWSSSTAVSDIRTKKNIRPLENVLPTLIDLSAIRFQYKEELNLGDEEHVGVIAQEIFEHFPDMVYHDKVSDRYIVHYDKLTTVLLRGLQEQQRMIENLTTSNVLLSSGYETLKAELDEVKSFIYQRSDMK